MRARGNFEVAAQWDEGKLTLAEIVSHNGGDCVVKSSGKSYAFAVNGVTVDAEEKDGVYTVPTCKGDVITVTLR
jgi:alpha-L-fucosidase 2